MSAVPLSDQDVIASPQHSDAELLDLFGARYWPEGETEIWHSPSSETYEYSCYIGEHEIEVAKGDSIWWIDDLEESGGCACVRPGPATVQSERFAIVVRGYKAVEQTRQFGHKNMVLPYVNGCSTDQIFPPRRLGDPTLQHLLIPPYSAEQAHHIHSTVRAVYVLRGRGISIVGMEKGTVVTELLPGMVCILDPMCPHHFETPQGEPIEVIPFHVYSAVPGENNHPMMRGTFLMNQGG